MPTTRSRAHAPERSPSRRRPLRTRPVIALGLALAAACRPGDDPETQTARQPVTLPEPAFPMVRDADLQAGAGHDWPAFAGNLANHNFSPLSQIRRGNVHELVPAWVYSTGVEGAMEAAPIVVGNTLYSTTAGGRVFALNAATGQELWIHDPELGPVTLCCGPVNRGVAAWGDFVYVATLDARLQALHSRSGALRWEVELADPQAGHSAIMAPLAADGRVFIGVSGQHYGIRGFLAAFDAQSGEPLWRWDTIPSDEEGGWWGEGSTTDPFGTPLNRDLLDEADRVEDYPEGWRRGGGGISTTPAYDHTSGHLFVNIEGPAPVANPAARPGDNLFTGSIVALDAATGRLIWHAQYLPNDAWGLSGGSPPFLFDRGGTRYVGFAGRTGWLYVFRASDGAPILRSDNFVPQEALFARPGEGESVRMAPGLNGGNAGAPVAFDPRNGLAYVGGVHQPMVYTPGAQPFNPGELFMGGSARFPPGEEQWGTVSALNLADGHVLWQRRTPAPVHAGALATAGGLVFIGQGTGTFDALDAANGRLLWQFHTGAGVHASPASYEVAGVQYVVVAAGGSYHFGTLPGDNLVAFALATRRPPTTGPGYPAANFARHGPATPGQHGGVRQLRPEQEVELPPEPPTEPADTLDEPDGDGDPQEPAPPAGTGAPRAPTGPRPLGEPVD
jgi:alcohol dehydrogenase (cytochrome c)